jgi:hypothetical protein
MRLLTYVVATSSADSSTDTTPPELANPTSNTVSYTNPPDVTPPTAPTLTATAVWPTRVSLLWTESVDNATQVSYTLLVDGSPYGAEQISYREATVLTGTAQLSCSLYRKFLPEVSTARVAHALPAKARRCNPGADFENVLPRHASAAKVADDGQHNNDDDDDPKPGRHSDPFVRHANSTASRPDLRRACGLTRSRGADPGGTSSRSRQSESRGGLRSRHSVVGLLVTGCPKG